MQLTYLVRPTAQSKDLNKAFLNPRLHADTNLQGGAVLRNHAWCTAKVVLVKLPLDKPEERGCKANFDRTVEVFAQFLSGSNVWPPLQTQVWQVKFSRPLQGRQHFDRLSSLAC